MQYWHAEYGILGHGVPTPQYSEISIGYYPRVVRHFSTKKGVTPRLILNKNGDTPKNVSPSSLVEVFLKRFQHSGSEPNNQAKILDVSSLLLSKLTVQLAPKNNNGMVNKITTFLEIRFKLTFFCCFHTDPLLHTALFSCVLLHQ